MPHRREARAWERAKAVAGSLAPAEAWRDQLAAALLEVPDVVSSWVFTCPPTFTFAARGVVLPEAAGRAVAEHFLKRLLPAVERDALALRMVRRFKTRPYAPFDVLGSDLVEKARRELLAPIGAIDVVHAFLAIDRDQVVGWLDLCTTVPGATLLARSGAQLAEVSRLVSQSIGHALRVAEDCGARAPRFASAPTRPLSERETQVAQLVGNGFSDLNIANRLRISEHTVAAHLRSIFGKLDVHSRAELASFAPLLCGSGFRSRPKGSR